ncbi:MAG TPA: glycosidase [Thermoanaerobacterales bacterium]|nr:glycosidase [Thermoanaerobacterales bacterium]
MLFNETMEWIRSEYQDLKDIDVVIGIPFYNEEDTLKNIISIAKNSLKTKNRKLIACVGDPAGESTLSKIKEFFGDEVIGFIMPTNINGRGYSIRAIMELARLLKSDLVLLEADLESNKGMGINSQWVDRIANPVFNDYDMAVACFQRHPFEDIIGSLLVSPVISTLYRAKLKDPLSGVFAIAHDLVEDFCTEFDQSSDSLGGYGINPWIVTTAIIWEKKVCEVQLGAKLSPISFGKKYIVIKEMLKTLFECINRDEDYWLNNSKVIKTPDIICMEKRETPLEITCNYAELFQSFIEGICHYDKLLRIVLDKHLLSQIEVIARQGKPLSFWLRIWPKIVYEFLVACSFPNDMLVEDLMEAFLAIFDGIAASFIKELEDFKIGFKDENIDYDSVIASQAQGVFDNTLREFLINKSELVTNWQSKIDELSPVLTPLDYLEFIPGVPIVLPKKLKGMNHRQIKTGDVFKRLQKKYNKAFFDFLGALGLDSNTPSEEISERLIEFMKDLENTIDRLCPGDLNSVEGTTKVVESIFRIIPHNKVLAVKWEILRKILQEYPPGNLIIRMGFRSLRELLENMDEREILTLASFTEDKDYSNRIFYWLKDNLRPDSFEEVELHPLIVNRNTFNYSGELREISDLNRLTACIPVMNLGKSMGGSFPKVRYFTRIGKSIVEGEHFSGLWKTYAKQRKEVGLKFVNSILGHYGKAMFSAHHIFENWHHRVFVSKLRTIVEKLHSENKFDEAKNLKTMTEGYGLSLVLNDGTFIPCSPWTWASYSFKGGDGIPTSLFLRVERDWFNHDLLEEIYKEMGYNAGEILQQVFQYISQGRESIDLAKALLGVKPYKEEVVIQELDYWPKAKALRRFSDKPILTPIKEHWWESRFVLNTAALRIKDKVYLLYRAFGDDEISRIGLAISDGYNIIDRLKEPIFVPEIEEEKRGCEDPRTVILDDKIIMLYTAYDGVVAQIATSSIAVDDFLNRKFDRWTRRGLAFPGLWDKDAIIFPEKIDGKYVIYHRIEPSIWIAYSDDLSFPWPRTGHKIIMGPRSGMMWDSLKIGAGAQPIKTRYGWLLIYHGVDQDMVYRLGVMLADLNDPGRLLYRSPNPTLSPETECEIGKKDECWVPNVVFTCGAVPAEDKELLDVEDEILVYYGAADTYICLATGTVGDMIPLEVRERLENRIKTKI